MIRKNIFSILVALVIMYLSLANANTFKNVSFINFPNIDKVVHFGMYFGLMSTIIFENRKSIQRTRQLFVIGTIPLSYGILMEIFQGIFTTTRFADIYDVLFNAFGIIGSIILWILIKPMIKI